MSKNELLKKYENERTMTDNWTRVMGYYRPARLVQREDGKQKAGSSYNKGKQSEFAERVFFRTQSCNCCSCKH